MKCFVTAALLSLLQLLAWNSTAEAVTFDFTESFTANDAEWRGLSTSQLVSHHANGGVADGGYISHIPTASAPAGNFVESNVPGGPSGAVIFRANSSASGGAFTGNWIDAGVTTVQAYVRHNFTEKPIDFFARLSSGGAAVFFGDTAVEANEWTLVNFEISPDNYTNAGATFEAAVSNVMNFQIAAIIRGGVSSPGTNIQFALDQVSLVPEPSSALLVLGATVFTWTLRRRRAR